MAEVDFGREKAGQLLVPVAMHGQQTQLVLNTGSSWSTLQQSLTSGLQIKSSESRLMNGTGHNVARFVSVHDLQIGQLRAPAVDFYVLAPNAPETPGIGGSLGANLLTWADVEIDPGQGKLRFFSQVHCPGAVVHWPHQDSIKIPLQISEDGKITILVNLDDKPMRAVVSTGASRSVLFSDAAEDQFGLKPASPGMEKVTDGTGKDNSDI